MGSVNQREGYHLPRRESPSPAQRRVLDALLEGKTNREIAWRLSLSFETVKWHISDLLGEMGLTDRHALAHWWRRQRAEMAPFDAEARGPEPAAVAEGGHEMKQQLESLKYDPLLTSHIGCIKGSLDYLGRDVSRAWLFGGTSHAFVINIHSELCPSGPTAWHSVALHRLAPNLGYRTDGVVAFRHADASGFPAKQAEAWDYVCRSLDGGIPCYGWNLGVPDYYSIHGYDDTGYYYSGPDCPKGAGPKPWQEVGNDEIGVLEMYSVEPCDPGRDATVVKDALSTALDHARTPEKWAQPERTFGPGAFETWASALEGETAGRFGLGYNGVVWAECRREAVAFLQEAKERLAGRADSLFDEAIGHFETVRDRLAAVTELYPFQPPPAGVERESVQSSEAAALLREAGSAEKAGLAVAEKLVATL
jgi:DNA-binding CsgD family transcriptional regulator